MNYVVVIEWFSTVFNV